MELLDERWTLLVVRELVTGSEHFNDLRRGVPRMSPTLLSKRLHQTWGIRWIGTLGDADLDPHLLLWDMHRNIDHSTVPSGRTVVRFRPDSASGTRDWWLVITPDDADVCDADPGYEIAVTLTGSLRRMVEIWRGDTPWSAALRSGDVHLDGPASLRRALPGWFSLSSFAAVPRPATGH